MYKLIQMKDIFSFKRFTLLERYKLPETLLHSLFFIIIVTGIYFSLLFCKALGWHGIYGYGSLVVSLTVLMLAIAPCLFENSLNKYNSIFDFTLPASTFEKYLHLYLKYVILIPVLCLGIIWILNSVISSLKISGLNEFTSVVSRIISIKGELMIYIMLQPVFFTGYFLFSNRVLIKSIVTSIFISIFVGIIMNEMSNYLMPEAHGIKIDNILSFSPIFNFPLSESSELMLRICNYGGPIIYLLGLWITSFFLLREKEI